MATVIDLEAIQARIEAQQGVSAQKSPQSAQRGLARELVQTVWQLMGSMYGTRWTSSYGDDIDPDRVWTAALHGLDESQVRSGMRRCLERGLEWPPSAPEFRAMCVGPVDSWEHRRVAAEDEAWRRRALPDLNQREREAEAIDRIRADIRAMLRRPA